MAILMDLNIRQPEWLIQANGIHLCFARVCVCVCNGARERQKISLGFKELLRWVQMKERRGGMKPLVQKSEVLLLML